MLKVVIRHADEDEGRVLGEFFPDKVDALVELVKNYGVWENNSKQEENMSSAIRNLKLQLGYLKLFITRKLTVGGVNLDKNKELTSLIEELEVNCTIPKYSYENFSIAVEKIEDLFEQQQQEIERLREVLEFYARDDTRGEKARLALVNKR